MREDPPTEMVPEQKIDLRDILIDAHAHFFFLKGGEAKRVRLWQILPSSLIIDKPKGAPMVRTILGYVPTIDGCDVYELEGKISAEMPPDQMPDTICIEVSPSGIKKLKRRLYPRVSFTPPIDVLITAESEKKAINGKIINFSAGGLRIETLAELMPTKKYSFKFTIETEDEAHDLNLPGTVAHELPGEGNFVYGIRFGEIRTGKGVKKKEASVEDICRTVDLISLVNRLLLKFQ